MKYILCVVCVSAVAILLASVDAGKEAENMIKEMFPSCVTESGATDDDITAMAEKELPTSTTQKCFSFCVMKQIGCLNEQADLQQEDCMNIMKMGTDNDTVVEMMDRVTKKCVGTKSPDNNNCETAGLLLKCMNDGAKEEGYEKM